MTDEIKKDDNNKEVASNVATAGGENVDTKTINEEKEDKEERGGALEQGLSQKIIKYTFFLVCILLTIYIVGVLIFKNKVHPIGFVNQLNFAFAEKFKDTDTTILVEGPVELFSIPKSYFVINNIKIINYKQGNFSINGIFKEAKIKFPIADLFLLTLIPENIEFTDFEIMVNESLPHVIEDEVETEENKSEENKETIENREKIIENNGDEKRQEQQISQQKDISNESQNKNKIQENTATIPNKAETSQSESPQPSQQESKKDMELPISFKNTNISFNNGTIFINGLTYSRKITDISLLLHIKDDEISLKGTSFSNEYPTKINWNVEFAKNNDFLGKFKITSDAFVLDVEMEGKKNLEEFKGKIDVDINSIQVFVKTMFNSNDILYDKIIDNSALKISNNFIFKDNILSVTDILFDGATLKGKGLANFNLTKEKEHKLELNFEMINLDKLVSTSLMSKNTKMDVKDIYIFNKENFNFTKKPRELSTIANIIKINPFNVVINADTVILNKNKIQDFKSDFILKDGVVFNNVSAKVEKSNVSLSIDKEQNFTIKGNDLSLFTNEQDDRQNKQPTPEQPAITPPPLEPKIDLSQGTNTDSISASNSDSLDVTEKKKDADGNENKQETNKDSSDILSSNVGFAITGKINSSHYRKLLLENIDFKISNFEGSGNIEYGLDSSGIVFSAIEINMNNVDLADVLKFKGKYDTLSSATLFLNVFKNNSFYKFDILNIKNTNDIDWSDEKYAFTVMTSNGYLSIYDINLNDKIGGNMSINIKGGTPKLSVDIDILNYEFKNKFDFNKFIYDFPTMENWAGNIKLSIKNSKFLDSNIGNAVLDSDIKNGIFALKKISFEDSFGGVCNNNNNNIGYLDMKFNRKFNLVLSCSGKLEEILYLFTNNKDISGNIGFGFVLYSEGLNMEEFLKNYLIKTEIVGSGVQVKGLGLRVLNEILFQGYYDKNVLDNININEILFSDENSFFIEKLKGQVNYTKQKGSLLLNTESKMINGVIKGKFDLLPNTLSGELETNYIMLSGSSDKIINLAIPINYSGKTGINWQHSTNLQMVDDYIKLLKQK